MRPEEAAWIGRTLDKLGASAATTVVNVGSSTGRFRQVTQPHIDAEIFGPLAARGVTTVHCDMKPDEGVDLVGDLLDPGFRERVAGLGADIVLANNLLEHVRDRLVLADCLAALPRPGGRLLVSVPYRYPYHADPIDTRFRPRPDEIAALFRGFALEDQAIVVSTSLWDDLVAALGRAGAARDVARRVVRLLFPFVRPRAWLSTVSALAWLARPRSVSIASLVKLDEAGGRQAESPAA